MPGFLPVKPFVRSLFLAAGFAAVASFAALVCTPLSAGGSKSDTEVKLSVKGSAIGADGKQTVEVTLKINDGWHIYANPVMNEDLASAQTEVLIKSGAKPAKAKIVYPKGEQKVDKLIGNYMTYKGEVKIQAQVERSAGDRSPLEVAVKIQACDKTRCLLPATLKATVK